ncbi:putative nitrate reductase, partial [Klebsiella pneumoniae subsp. pneumoniae KPNIH18]
AFGADVVPCSYDDVENSDLVVLVGSNAAWAHPVLFQRLAQAKRDNPRLRIVAIDPRPDDRPYLTVGRKYVPDPGPRPTSVGPSVPGPRKGNGPGPGVRGFWFRGPGS